MEKFPKHDSKVENKSEKILTSQEISAVISQYAENHIPSRELSDEKGIYLKEVEVKGEKEGEITVYQYMRKGNHSNHNESDVAAISCIFYQDGVPVGGDRIAKFNEDIGTWENI
jgi:hypothetical protein